MSDSSLNRAKNTIRRVKKGVSKLTIKISGTIGGLLGKNTDDSAKKTKDSMTLGESNNVIRKQTTVSIGDLNGNYGALLGNLSSTELIDNSRNWKGGDTKLILHGDIFADRYPHSIDIASYITQLQNQARLQGGDITILAGNHEDMAFSYLTGEPIVYIHGKGYPMGIDLSNEAQPGLIELESYINPGITLEEIKKKSRKIAWKNAPRSQMTGNARIHV